MDGKGCLYHSNGQIRYKGGYKDNVYSGYGELYTQYEVYKGHYRDGLYYGKGKLSWADGE